jgi:uncharacterized protein involved in type VI secretion and phage assembly
MADGSRPPIREKVYGKHSGTVLNSSDPERLGRLTALVPEVLREVPTGWANPCVPYAGIGSGFFSLPPPGAGVWIEFEGGDVSRPIWSGCYWGVGEAPMPPPAGAPGEQTTKIWRSDLGLSAVLDDASQTMTLSDATGENKVEISVTTGTVTIKGMARIVHDGKVVQVGSGGARHPAAFGDDLLIYLNQLVQIFNTHVHPGELAIGLLPVTPAPPVGPMPPAKPSLISTKVFVE